MQNCEVTQKDLTFDTNNKKKLFELNQIFGDTWQTTLITPKILDAKTIQLITKYLRCERKHLETTNIRHITTVINKYFNDTTHCKHMTTLWQFDDVTRRWWQKNNEDPVNINQMFAQFQIYVNRILTKRTDDEATIGSSSGSPLVLAPKPTVQTKLGNPEQTDNWILNNTKFSSCAILLWNQPINNLDTNIANNC